MATFAEIVAADKPDKKKKKQPAKAAGTFAEIVAADRPTKPKGVGPLKRAAKAAFRPDTPRFPAGYEYAGPARLPSIPEALGEVISGAQKGITGMFLGGEAPPTYSLPEAVGRYGIAPYAAFRGAMGPGAGLTWGSIRAATAPAVGPALGRVAPWLKGIPLRMAGEAPTGAIVGGGIEALAGGEPGEVATSAGMTAALAGLMRGGGDLLAGMKATRLATAAPGVARTMKALPPARRPMPSAADALAARMAQLQQPALPLPSGEAVGVPTPLSPIGELERLAALAMSRAKVAKPIRRVPKMKAPVRPAAPKAKPAAAKARVTPRWERQRGAVEAERQARPYELAKGAKPKPSQRGAVYVPSPEEFVEATLRPGKAVARFVERPQELPPGRLKNVREMFRANVERPVLTSIEAELERSGPTGKLIARDIRLADEEARGDFGKVYTDLERPLLDVTTADLVRTHDSLRGQPGTPKNAGLRDTLKRITDTHAKQAEGLEYEITLPDGTTVPFKGMEGYGWHQGYAPDTVAKINANPKFRDAWVDEVVKRGLARNRPEAIRQLKGIDERMGQGTDASILRGLLSRGEAKDVREALAIHRRTLKRGVGRPGSLRHGRKGYPFYPGDPLWLKAAGIYDKVVAGKPLTKPEAKLVKGWEEDAQAHILRSLRDVTRSLAEARRFGFRDKRLYASLEKVLEEGAEPELVESLFRTAMGRVRWARSLSEFSSITTNASVLMKMSLSAIINSTERFYNVPIASWSPLSGFRQFTRGLMRAGFLRTRPAAERAVIRAGTIDPQMASFIEDKIGTMPESGPVSRTLHRWVSKFLQKNRFWPVERRTRIISDSVGIHVANASLQDLIAARAKGGLRGGLKAKRATRWLRDYLKFPEAEIEAMVKRGTMTDQEVARAGLRWSDLTQKHYGSLYFPEKWGTPWGRVTFQFRRWPYGQFKLVRDVVWNELKHGNPYPAMYLLAGFGALGAGVATIRYMIAHPIEGARGMAESLQKGNWRYVYEATAPTELLYPKGLGDMLHTAAEAYAWSSPLGIPHDAFETYRMYMKTHDARYLYRFVLGPSFSTWEDIATGAAETLPRVKRGPMGEVQVSLGKPRRLLRALVRPTPFGGGALTKGLWRSKWEGRERVDKLIRQALGTTDLREKVRLESQAAEAAEKWEILAKTDRGRGTAYVRRRKKFLRAKLRAAR